MSCVHTKLVLQTNPFPPKSQCTHVHNEEQCPSGQTYLLYLKLTAHNCSPPVPAPLVSDPALGLYSHSLF